MSTEIRHAVRTRPAFLRRSETGERVGACRGRTEEGTHRRGFRRKSRSLFGTEGVESSVVRTTRRTGGCRKERREDVESQSLVYSGGDWSGPGPVRIVGRTHGRVEEPLWGRPSVIETIDHL